MIFHTIGRAQANGENGIDFPAHLLFSLTESRAEIIQSYCRVKQRRDGSGGDILR